MALEEAYATTRSQEGRKLSSMTVLCSVYREHIARDMGLGSVKAGHAMRARALFSP